MFRLQHVLIFVHPHLHIEESLLPRVTFIVHAQHHIEEFLLLIVTHLHIKLNPHDPTKKNLHHLIKHSGFENVSVRSALHLQAAQSIQNVLVGKFGYHPKITYGKTPIYPALLLLAAPFCLTEHLIGRGGMMNFMAQKPT